MPQAQAFDFGEALKDVIKETTQGATSSTNATGSESEKAFNWKVRLRRKKFR